MLFGFFLGGPAGYRAEPRQLVSVSSYLTIGSVLSLNRSISLDMGKETML